jgi:hypothetical protein
MSDQADGVKEHFYGMVNVLKKSLMGAFPSRKADGVQVATSERCVTAENSL